MTRHRIRQQLDAETLGQEKVFGSPQGPIYWCSSPWKQDTTDELHKRSRKKSRGSRLYLTGGPFTALEYRYSRSNTYVSLNSGGSNPAYSYQGWLCNNYFGSNPSLNAYYNDTVDLVGVGTRGIARYRPGNPVANLGQAIYELRDIPRIPGASVFAGGFNILRALKEVIRLKSLGKEYLNIEFGWKPFIQDLLSVVGAQDSLHKALTQLKRDNGRVVRRHGTVSHDETSSVTSLDGTCYLYPIIASPLYWSTAASNFKGSLYSKVSSRYWFSGAFKYWIPDIMKQPYPSLSTTLKLLGIYPSPSLVYEVMPWSWLFDWFTTIGPILDNLSGNAAENLVMQYGYAMGWHESVDIASSQARMRDGKWAIASVTRRITSKRRVKAYPFGFSVGLPSFTDRQIAILTALGISRR